MKQRNNGFTLIEVLGIIIILSIIGLIITPSIYKVLYKSKEGLYKEQINRIIVSGKHFGTNNVNRLPKSEEEVTYVSLGELNNLGFLDTEDVIDPRNKKQMSGCLSIKKIGNSYNYKYEEESVCKSYFDASRPKFNEYENDPKVTVINDVLTKEIEVEVNETYDIPLAINKEGKATNNPSLDISNITNTVSAVDKTGNPVTVTGPEITRGGVKQTTVTTNKLSQNDEDVFQLKYVATDEATGIKATLLIKIKIVDTIPPVITVEGKSTNYKKVIGANKNSSFSIPTSTVTDNSKESIEAIVTSNVVPSIIGIYKVKYEAEDSSKNKSRLIVTVEVNNQKKPSIDSVSGNPTSWTNKDVVLKVDGVTTYTGDLSKVEYSFDNGVTWQKENYKVFEENQTVKIKIRDLSVKEKENMESETVSETIVYIDKLPPTKPVVQLKEVTNVRGSLSTSGTWTKSNVNAIYTSTDQGGSGLRLYQISLDRKTWKNVTSPRTETKEQDQQYYIRAIDKAGNVSEVSNKYIIKIDKTAPTCTSSGGVESWKNKSNVGDGIILKGTCSDIGTYLSGCINPANIPVTPASGYTYDASGNVTRDAIKNQIASNTQSPGKVYDEAGNETICPANQSAYIDLTNPTCSISKNSGDTAGVTVQVSSNDASNSGVSSSNTKSVYYPISSLGTKTVTVYDNAGNSGTCSITIASKTQYRYTSRSCSTGKRCSAASCAKYGTKSVCSSTTTWVSTGSCSNMGYSTCAQLCSSNSSKYRNCAYSSTKCDDRSDYWKHRCTFEKATTSTSCKTVTDYSNCKLRSRSCSKCGCETWGSYGGYTAWSDTNNIPSNTNCTQYAGETRTVAYSY